MFDREHTDLLCDGDPVKGTVPLGLHLEVNPLDDDVTARDEAGDLRLDCQGVLISGGISGRHQHHLSVVLAQHKLRGPNWVMLVQWWPSHVESHPERTSDRPPSWDGDSPRASCRCWEPPGSGQLVRNIWAGDKLWVITNLLPRPALLPATPPALLSSRD